ncbi:uncharacterized protein LOC123319907 [Coccinella septempunctata]|nr:uncharacterized protein LOC123306354 [Coccinella septempunctata]XP_044751322.1 uncharacterized protein LOC123311436 [Coccinella septempunctata]XP_044756190.1 uncharacterized protein LOC123314861 [Coccinella septempunctata]XP_044762924.1 uncharacterized protein LOC123319907 [Coccinella septempunctata]
MFHLCTGTVGIVDRDSGSDLAGVVTIGRLGLIHGAGVPVCETSTATGGSTPSPKSISDGSRSPEIRSGWIGDTPGELGTSTSKRDLRCRLDGCGRSRLLF